MEDTLRVSLKVRIASQDCGLNPCFNGRYSQRFEYQNKRGLYSVLILVLMEDTLRASQQSLKFALEKVLILVLMEDTLRGFRECV